MGWVGVRRTDEKETKIRLKKKDKGKKQRKKDKKLKKKKLKKKPVAPIALTVYPIIIVPLRSKFFEVCFCEKRQEFFKKKKKMLKYWERTGGNVRSG